MTIFQNMNSSAVLRALAVLFISLGLSTTAHAMNSWTLLPAAGNALSEDLATTFHDLLSGELAKHRGGNQVTSNQSCKDLQCAVSEGRRLKVQTVYYVSIHKLGSKLIIRASEATVDGASLGASHKMTIDRIEDLDSAATRLAKSLVTNQSVDKTAELGTITKRDSRKLNRRHGDNGYLLRVGGVVPLSNSLAGAPFGVLMDTGYWYEATYFAIEGRIGFRFSTDSTKDGFFFDSPIDVSAVYIPLLGDFTPFFGGGLGMRFVYEDRLQEVTTGEIIQTTHETLVDDSGFGLGVHAKIGMLMFRTWSTRMTFTVEYNMAFIELNNHKNPQSLNFGLGVIF